jgi:hypothetical protein
MRGCGIQAGASKKDTTFSLKILISFSKQIKRK